MSGYDMEENFLPIGKIKHATFVTSQSNVLQIGVQVIKSVLKVKKKVKITKSQISCGKISMFSNSKEHDLTFEFLLLDV